MCAVDHPSGRSIEAAASPVDQMMRWGLELIEIWGRVDAVGRTESKPLRLCVLTDARVSDA